MDTLDSSVHWGTKVLTNGHLTASRFAGCSAVLKDFDDGDARCHRVDGPVAVVVKTYWILGPPFVWLSKGSRLEGF